jgi:predicted esterase
MPNGPADQTAAVEGIKTAITAIELVIDKIKTMFSLSRDKIAVVGFSAGGVMALQVAAHSEQSLAAAVCHGGAILEPDKLPFARDSYMPILLTHAEDDSIFDWYERYLPMKNALLKQDYNVHTIEWLSGGHSLSSEDMIVTGVFLSKCFKYPKEWRHPRQYMVKQMDLDEEFIYSSQLQ